MVECECCVVDCVVTEEGGGSAEIDGAGTETAADDATLSLTSLVSVLPVAGVSSLRGTASSLGCAIGFVCLGDPNEGSIDS